MRHVTPRIINITNNLLTGGHLIHSLSPSSSQEMVLKGYQDLQSSSDTAPSTHVKDQIMLSHASTKGEAKRQEAVRANTKPPHSSAGYERSMEKGDGEAALPSSSNQSWEQPWNCSATSCHFLAPE